MNLPLTSRFPVRPVDPKSGDGTDHPPSSAPLAKTLANRIGAPGARKLDRCIAALTRATVAAMIDIQCQQLSSCLSSCGDGMSSAHDGASPPQTATEGSMGAALLAGGGKKTEGRMSGWNDWDIARSNGSWHSRFLWSEVSLRDVIKALDRLRPLHLFPAGSELSVGLDNEDVLRIPPPPLQGERDLGCEELLEHFKTSLGFAERVVHEERLPARPARYALPSRCGQFCPAVQRALSTRGATRMFLHQAEAIDSILGNRQHTVIATSTASGK